MKPFIAGVFLSLCVLGVSSANDKDALREGCSALKDKAKRTACFDAIERLSTTAPPTPVEQKASPAATTDLAPAKKPLLLNTRVWMNCEAFDFAELNSLSGEELKAISCSYDMGFSEGTKWGDTRKMERCINNNMKVSDMLTRKFAGNKAQCSDMIGWKPQTPK